MRVVRVLMFLILMGWEIERLYCPSLLVPSEEVKRGDVAHHSLEACGMRQRRLTSEDEKGCSTFKSSSKH